MVYFEDFSMERDKAITVIIIKSYIFRHITAINT